MKKILLAAAAVACGAACFAAGTTNNNAVTVAERIAKAGGLVLAKGTFTGKILVADAQSRVAHSNFVNVAASLTKSSDCNVVAEKAAGLDASVLLKERGADIAILVVDDPKLPSMTVAPDDRWGVVNVAKLVDDLPAESAKAKFLPSRARKQVIRAFSILSGGAASSFPGNAMNAMSPRDLDFAGEGIPVDRVDAIHAGLKKINVVPRTFMTYARACAQGCAAAPTNDVQKAIWEAFHSIPKKGLEIKYDAKKGK